MQLPLALMYPPAEVMLLQAVPHPQLQLLLVQVTLKLRVKVRHVLAAEAAVAPWPSIALL